MSRRPVAGPVLEVRAVAGRAVAGRVVAALGLALAGGLALAACAPQVAARGASATPSSAENAATQQKGTAGKRVRLGWVSWQDDTSIIFCNRRVDDNGNPVGVLGPCKQLGADGVEKGLISWFNTEQPDRSRSDASPTPCALVLEDARPAPDPKPARLWLVEKTGRVLVDEWMPDAAKLTADAYAIEPSFSPDGKLVALLHLAVGLGEGERTIEIASAKLLPAPACE